MEEKVNFIEPLFKRVEEFGKVTIELYKLKVLESAVDITSTVVSRAVVFLVLYTFIALFSIGVALWLGDILGKMYYGFFCVAGFYGIIWSVLYFILYKWMKKRVSNSIVSQVLNQQ